MEFDHKAFGMEMGLMVREAIAPLAERIKALEAELATVRGQTAAGVSGAMIDRDGELIVTTVRGELTRLGRVVGKDAAPADVDAIARQVLALVEAQAKDELSAELPDLLARSVDAWMARNPPPTPAAPDVAKIADDVESRVLLALPDKVAAAIARSVTDHPVMGGTSVTVDDVAPMIRDEIKRAVEAIPPPEVVGIGGAMIDRDGELIVTTTKGDTIRVGRVVGSDGADFSEVEIDYDGERTLIIRGKGGEIRKHLPIPIDRGYWRDGMTCEKGDIVTHDGSAWIALSDTRERPGISQKDQWRMLARKGRDGAAKPVKLEQ